MKTLATSLFLFFVFSLHAQDTTTVGHPTGPDPNALGHNDNNDNGQGNDNTKDKSSPDFSKVLTPLLSYNFSSGNTSLSGLTPIIYYGWTKDFNLQKDKKNSNLFTLGIQPYAAGELKIKDSSNYIPALMLPGIAGINVTTMFQFGHGSAKFLWSPLNLGLKLNTNFKDSNTTILQHNIRTAIGFKYTDYMQLAIQFTAGWHNLTSESNDNFKKIFNHGATDITYLTIVFQTILNKANTTNAGKSLATNNILFLEWRCLTNKGAFPNLPNNQILTIGLRKDFDLTSLIPGAGHAQLQ